jgi:hypothetical protein
MDYRTIVAERRPEKEKVKPEKKEGAPGRGTLF